MDARARHIELNRTLRAIAAVVFALSAGVRAAHTQVPGELRGRITDSESGRAIAGARIEVVGRTEHALSQANGSFVVRGLAPGQITARVRALGYAPRDTVVAVVNGRSVRLDVPLVPVVSRLDPIVVRSTRDTANALVLDRSAIERSGRRDVGEILQSVPGVVVTQSGGPSSPSRISIRGSSANEVLVLIDGNPVNSPITGEADLSRIGIEAIECVTVLRGAQSARYGGRALAGVVLIETRRAGDEIGAAARVGAWGERNGSISIGRASSVKSLRSVGSVTADYRDTRGDFSYQIPAVRGGGTAHRVNGGARSFGALASASVDGDDRAARLRADWQTRTRGMPGSIVQPSTTGHERDSRIAGGIDGRWRFGRVSSNAAIDAVREHATFVDPSPPFGSVYNDTVNANSVIVTTTSAAAFALGTLSAGGEGRALAVTSTMLAPGAPNRQHQFGAWMTTSAFRSMGSGIDLGVDASARADWDSFLSGATVSPRVGLTAARGMASLSVSYGHAYAPPSLADQFFHEGVLVRPNPALRPEHVRGELEVRAAVRDARLGLFLLGADAAAFRANVDGMILWQPDFRFIWSPSNFDVTRSGWELSGRVDIPRLRIDVGASASRSDVRYAGPVLTGQVVYRPRSTANLTAGISRWDTRLEVTSRYVGTRRTVPGSSLNSLDPYSLSDVKLSRIFARQDWRIDAILGVENVFDRAASMLVDYPFPGRTWTVGFRIRLGGDRIAAASAGQR